MKRHTAYTRRLRSSNRSAFLALFAMAFQILFAMEHASAMAGATARTALNGAPMGFLEICTARGLLRIPAPAGSSGEEQPTPRTNVAENCAVCGTTAISGAIDALASSALSLNSHLLAVAITSPIDIDPPSTKFKRSGSTRGPPMQGIHSGHKTFSQTQARHLVSSLSGGRAV